MPGLPSFSFDGNATNVELEWSKWLNSFEIWLRACRIDDEEWKKNLLLLYAGPSVQQIFTTLPELPGSDMRGPLANVEKYTPNMTVYEEAVAKLNNFFLPKANPTFERHLLRQIKQQSGESFDGFVLRLRLQAERCGFGDKLEENLKDQIIENCESTALRREMLKQGDVCLDKILNIAKIFETVSRQEKTFSNVGEKKHLSEEVNKIGSSTYRGKRKYADFKQMECHRCGYTGHLARENSCPAKGKSCSKCGGRDHFAKKMSFQNIKE